jgi:tetratricopeptide (TPR) repeat protein
LLRQVVLLDRKVFGEQHPSLAVDLSGLGRILMLQKRYVDAEPLLRESLEIRLRRLTPDDERLLKTQATLGECLVAQGRDAEAEPLLAEAIRHVRDDSRSQDSFWTSIIATLEKLYQRAGQPKKAQELGTFSQKKMSGREHPH